MGAVPHERLGERLKDPESRQWAEQPFRLGTAQPDTVDAGNGAIDDEPVARISSRVERDMKFHSRSGVEIDLECGIRPRRRDTGQFVEDELESARWALKPWVRQYLDDRLFLAGRERG